MSTAESSPATVQEMFVGGAWRPSASGETFEATSPATGEVIGAVPQGDRSDAQARHRRRGRRPSPGGRRRPPSPAPPRCTASPTSASAAATSSPARSRSTRASRCTRSPTTRSTSCWPCWRGAAEDGVRLEGSIPPSASPGKRVLLMRRPLGPVGRRHPVELALHDARGDRRPRAGGRQHGRLDAGAEHGHVLGAARRVRRGGRPAARRLQLRHRPRRRSSATRSSPTRAPSPSASSARPRRAGGSPSARPASACCSRWAATGRSSCSTAPTSTPRPRRRSARASCARGQSCTAGERLLVAEARARRVRRAAGQRGGGGRPARRPVRAGDDDGPAQQRERRRQDGRARRRRPDRGARVVAGGERSTDFPTDLYWTATVLDGVAEDAEVAREETFGPIAPVVPIRALEHAIELANASPYGLLAAIFTGDVMDGLRFAERSGPGWSTSTRPRTTGRTTSPSAAARAPTAASAASAAATRSSSSPSCRRS